MSRIYGRFQIQTTSVVIESLIEGYPDMIVQKSPGDLVICPDCWAVVPSDHTGGHDAFHVRLDRTERWAGNSSAVIGGGQRGY